MQLGTLNTIRRRTNSKPGKIVVVLFVCLLCHTGVQADVYKITQPIAKSVANILGNSGQSAGERMLVVNGVTMRAEVSQSHLDTEAVLLRVIEERKVPASKDMPKASVIHATKGSTLDAVVDIATAAAAAIDLQLIEGPDWSMLLQLDAASSPDVKGERKSSAGLSFVFVKQNGDEYTTVWDIKLDSLEDFLKMVFTGDGDVPGDDLPGIMRYPGSERTLTFSEFNQATESHMIVYKGKGSPKMRAKHYKAQFIQAGFRLDKEDFSSQSDALLLLSNGGAQVTVFVRKNPNPPQKVLDIIQIRLLVG